MKKNKKIYCFHGFLGMPSDWDFLDNQGFLSSFEIEKVDLYASFQTFGFPSLKEWASLYLKNLPVSKDCKPILIGYSMGGRAALHLLQAAPHFWRLAVLVSTHPGLSSISEQSVRLEKDRVWSERFKTENWTHLIDDWNHQPVFLGSRNMNQREEGLFNRLILSEMLDFWSVARQEDFAPILRELSTPVFWISGQQDVGYVNRGDWLASEIPKLQHLVIPGAGHRVIWDMPQNFLDILRTVCS